MKFGADAVAHEITHDAELRALHDRLHGRPNVANMIARLRGVDTSRERLLRHVEQSLGLRIDLAHGDRDGAIGEVPFVTDADVDRDDVPILQYALWRRNAVHDLAIDRRADAAGKAIEALEGRRGAIVGTNEVFGDLVELTRR